MTDTALPPLNTLTGLWIGDLRGTSLGNIFAETSIENDKLKFRISVSVRDVVTTFEGILDIEKKPYVLPLNATDSKIAEQYPKPNARVEIDVLNEKEINGRWSTTAGHLGVVWLSRTRTGTQASASGSPESKIELPTEFLAREVPLPKIVIYRDELEVLISKMRSLIGTSADVVVTTKIGSNDITQFANDFLKRTDLPSQISHMRLNINDGRQPLQSSINVVISNHVPSQFIVQSEKNIWMNGVSAELNEFFERYTNKAITYFQRHGLNINGLVLLAVIATLPELSLGSRFAFVFLALVLMALFFRVHSYVNSTRVYLSPRIARDWLSAETPRIKSGLLTASLVAVFGAGMTWIYQLLLQGGLPDFFDWIGRILGK